MVVTVGLRFIWTVEIRFGTSHPASLPRLLYFPGSKSAGFIFKKQKKSADFKMTGVPFFISSFILQFRHGYLHVRI